MAELSTIDLMHKVVALLVEARSGGWQICSLQAGDFKGSDRFDLKIWRDPPPENPAEVAVASATCSPWQTPGGSK